MMVMAVGPPPPVPSAPDRQTTPQSMGSDAAEGVGGAFPIVGIGMSAGGLEVATSFPNAMPVVQIEDGMEIGAAVFVSRPLPGTSRLSSPMKKREDAQVASSHCSCRGSQFGLMASRPGLYGRAVRRRRADARS